MPVSPTQPPPSPDSLSSGLKRNIEALRQRILGTLEDVRLAVTDWSAMRERARQIAKEVFDGVPRDETGGWALVAHPTIVWGSSDHLLFFATTSLPLRDEWRDHADRERFRVGAGTILSFGR